MATKTGTVIHATHRPQDLIPVFLDELQDHDQEAYLKLYNESRPVDVFKIDDEHPWWDSEDAYWLLDDLFDALNAAAPEGYYFGPHPGDGSDFGFWKVED